MNRKILNKFVVFLSVFLLLSCEKDYETEVQPEGGRDFLKKVNLDDLPLIKEGIDAKKTSNLTSNLLSDYLNLINNDSVTMITDSLGHKSYTFGLNIFKTDTLSNLIVKETKDGLNFYLAEYTSPNFKDWRSNISNNIKTTIPFTVSIKNLEANTTNTNLQARCVFVTEKYFMCPSGYHTCSWEEAGSGSCDYLFSEWIMQVSSVLNCGTGVIGGYTGDPSPIVTTPNTSGGGPPNPNEDNPCNKLKDLFDVNKANIKPWITNLATQITPLNQTENGVVVMKNEQGDYINSGIPAGQGQNEIGIPVSVNNLIAAIHTHPMGAYPMFSFSDLMVLNEINNYLEPHNDGLATFIVVAKNNENDINPVVYAVVLNPFFGQTIQNMMDNPEYGNLTQQQIVDKKNLELQNKFIEDSNPERAFLQFISGLNISLYKANATLTNWKELKLSSNSPYGPVNSTNCN